MEIKAGEFFFLDTNVLLAATDESRANHRAARAVFTEAQRSGCHLGVSGQILREYLVVATRPAAADGLGLNTEAAVRNVGAFARRTVFCDESEAVSVRLRRLAASGNLKGMRIHDANVVATLLAHGVSRLITENADDFQGFPEIEILPLHALAASRGSHPESPPDSE